MRRQAEKRLRILEAATSLGDVAHLPGNRLEALSGNRKGQYSIRINQQWRICFAWPSGADGPEDVEITDYHYEESRPWPAPPLHPGEILADELAEIGMSAAELARRIEVPANRVSQIIAGKRQCHRRDRLQGTRPLLRHLRRLLDASSRRPTTSTSPWQRLGNAIERIETRETDHDLSPTQA